MKMSAYGAVVTQYRVLHGVTYFAITAKIISPSPKGPMQLARDLNFGGINSITPAPVTLIKPEKKLN